MQLSIILPNGKKTINVGINIRPNVIESLNEINQDYHCIAYTASERCYADKVLDHIDPENKIFKYRLYRNNCVKVEHDSKTLYIKDLRIIKDVNFNDIIIIDNSVLSFAFQLDNGIPILPYYHEDTDCEMKFLVKYLKYLTKSKDIRVENSKMMQLNSLMNKLDDKKSVISSFSRMGSIGLDNESIKLSEKYSETILSSKEYTDEFKINIKSVFHKMGSSGIDRSYIKNHSDDQKSYVSKKSDEIKGYDDNLSEYINSNIIFEDNDHNRRASHITSISTNSLSLAGSQIKEDIDYIFKDFRSIFK